jgi:PAS domain S-box-containing protein
MHKNDMAANVNSRWSNGARQGTPISWGIVAGVGLTLLVLVIGGVLGFKNALRLNDDRRLVTHTREVLGSLEALLSILKDAETGQRGYLLTEDPKYLEPYEDALQHVSGSFTQLQELVSDNPEQRARLEVLGRKMNLRLDVLKQGVLLMQKGERAASLSIVLSGTGKALMDDLRKDIAIMQRAEDDLLKTRDIEATTSYRATVAVILLTSAIGVVLLGVVGYLFQRNLTQKQRAALVLSEEKERLRTTLASIGDAVISTDSSGSITYLNPIAEQLTGWTNAEALGTPLSRIFIIVNETTRQPEESPAIRALKDGVIVGLANHTILIARDGAEWPIDDSAAPIRSVDGQLVGCVLVFRDITRRRQAEQQLRQREEQFRRTVTEIAIPTMLHADDDTILLVNKAWTDITGYRHEDIPTIRDWTQRAYGERHASAKDYIDRQLTSDVRVDSGEWEVTTATGEKRVWHFFTTPVGREVGGRRLLVSNAVDVTEQRRAEQALRASEERLRMAQHVSKIGTFEWNIQTGVNTWTPELETMYGLSPGEFAGTQRTWEEMIHPEDRPHTIRSVGEALANGAFADEWRVVWSDGSTHWLAGRGMVFKDEDGKPLRLLGINIDITERKQAEEELRRLATELSDADHRKDEFLATLAHELRNPLAPIRNGLQLLQRMDGSHTAHEQVHVMMERQVDQLVRLVDDLMDVSRITRGTLDLRRDQVQLAMVLQNAVETAKPLIESKGHKLTITLPTAPTFVDADATRLAQVFANLLNNAAKYTDRGGHIWLTAERQSGELLVTVKDTGVGIPSEMLPKIFEMFAQVDQTLEKSQGGLGIGLALARRLVEMHGGKIEARSNGSGQGSEFIVRLGAALALVRQVTPATDENDAAFAPNQCRILVADDNEDSVISLPMLLRSMGNEVRTAAAPYNSRL